MEIEDSDVDKLVRDLTLHDSDADLGFREGFKALRGKQSASRRSTAL